MVFKQKMNKLYLTILLLLYQTKIIYSNYISIPFKIYNENIDSSISENLLMSEYISNKIYFTLQIGQPYQKVLGTINSLEFELLMKKGNFFFHKNNYEFISTKSNSFSVIAEKTISYFDSFDSNYVQDNFDFCVKYNFNNKKCESYKTYKMNFIYSKKSSIDEEENNRNDINIINYMEIGLNLKTHYGTKYSLYTNLMENKYISSNTWFLYYFPQTQKESTVQEEEGVLILGEDPLNLFPNKYNSSNIIYAQGINKNYDYRNYWSLIFTEVKMKASNSNEDFHLDNNVQGVINHNYKVIVGSQSYMEKIETKFFGEYLNRGFCKKNLLNNKFYYYVCDSNLLSMEQIKNSFPTLYMKQLDFNYIFELNATDLFITKGDRIFFLVVFNINNPTNSFLLGSIFLKKYFFYFDNNRNQIAFLQENTNNPNTKNNIVIVHWYNSPGTVIILIILFIIIGGAGFYFGKKIYNRRKLRANELEDQFDYKSQKEGKNSNKFNLEMKLGI